VELEEQYAIALGVLILLERRATWLHGPSIVGLTALAVGFKEQGLVIVPVVLMAWWTGAPGATKRTAGVLAAMAAAYVVVRMMWRQEGLPLFEQAIGLGFTQMEPPEATAHAGRLTTPLFGAGLIDAIPDSVIVANASAQPATVRGTVNRVNVLLPNESEPASLNTTRVGRFGWKAAIANLTQFSADAYVNEMGITSQHCVRGISVLTFATESKPNGVAVPPGCDDRSVPSGAPGVPAETDDVVGSCAGGLTEIEEDVSLFTTFMTFLAPAPRLPIDPAINLQGGTVFNRIGCAQCHLLKDYVTPSQPLNGVPGNFKFRPRSDFLLHDIGTGDGIGNDGDTRAKTNSLRTAPLWGLHLRTRFLHDGSATTIEQAIARHGGQAASSRSAFNALSASDRNAMLAAMKSD